MASELKTGDRAPDFRATAVGGKYGSGQEVSLQDLRGRWVVLYFYPKDDTPGCTTQACALRDSWSQVEKRGEIFGVSPDSVASHEKFKLTFPLASDEDHKVAEAFGVWVEKSMYGKTYMGMERTSFLVGADGKVVQVWRKVKPEAHAAQVIEAAKGL